MIYCDTSFLFSLYIEDDCSQRATEQISSASETLVWTPWHQLEFTSALEARVGRKANTRKEADKVFAVLRKQVDEHGIYARRTMDWNDALTRACELAGKWGARFGCRSLDVLHVGICLELHLKEFWSFDKRQRNLAKAAGLQINKS